MLKNFLVQTKYLIFYRTAHALNCNALKFNGKDRDYLITSSNLDSITQRIVSYFSVHNSSVAIYRESVTGSRWNQNYSPKPVYWNLQQTSLKCWDYSVEFIFWIDFCYHWIDFCYHWMTSPIIELFWASLDCFATSLNYTTAPNCSWHWIVIATPLLFCWMKL